MSQVLTTAPKIILTPIRIVGDDVICDKIGAMLWAIGTRIGDKNGIATLASYKLSKSSK